VERKLK
jgi:uncharacterized membrane protein